MLAYLEGEVIFKSEDFVLLLVGGTGFKVFVGFDAPAGERLELFTHLVVREDALLLYGFRTYEELEMFEILLGVSGIGPKSAMGVLIAASPGIIKTAIVQEDTTILTRVSGIGKKTAARVILELKNKFSADDLAGLKPEEIPVTTKNEATDALIGLGYRPQEVRRVLAEIPADKTLEEKIRLALKSLGRGK